MCQPVEGGRSLIRRSLTTVLFAALVVAALPTAVAAQVVRRPAATVYVAVDVHELWLREGVPEGLREPLADHQWIYVDSVRAGAVGTRVLHTRMQTGEPGALVLGPDGGFRSSAVAPRDLSRRRLRTGEDSARAERGQLFRRDRLSMPALRLAELVARFRPPDLAPGARWADTLALDFDRGPYAQRLSGVRWHVLERDTLVDGRTHWVVRDSAAVTYEERWLEPDYSLDGMIAVSRRGEGIMRGRSVRDPSAPLPRARHDTTTWAGTVAHSYPDGRVLEADVSLRRDRATTLHDRAGFEARREERRRDLRAVRGQPPRPLSATRPEVADTAVLLGGAVDRIRRGPIDAAALDLLLPYMMDAPRAFRIGVDVERIFEAIRMRLVRAPPAITSDTAAWPCEPSVCARLAALESDAEPRIDDLALLTRFLLDPVPWAAQARARATVNTGILGPVIPLVDGIGATWPAATKAPLPDPGADWRAWTEWMNGRDSAYARPGARPPEAVRFNDSHRFAIRFAELLTGREIEAELAARAAESEQDSARWVFEHMRLALGAYEPVPDTVAARLTSSSVPLVRLGGAELDILFRDAEPADEALSAELLDRLLAILLEGADPWPLRMREGAWGHELRPLEGPPEWPPLVVVGDALPDAVARAWADRATLITGEAWSALAEGAGGTALVPGRVERVGPFARVTIRTRALGPRVEGRRFRGWEAGTTLTLMPSEAGWVVVGMDGWTT